MPTGRPWTWVGTAEVQYRPPRRLNAARSRSLPDLYSQQNYTLGVQKTDVRLTEEDRSGVRHWIAPAIPVIAAASAATLAAIGFANEVHGYVAAYWNPAVMVLAVAFVIVGAVTLVPRFTRRFGVGAIIGGLLLVPLFLVAVNVLDATGQIRWRNQPQVRLGPNVRASLVVLLRSDATNDEINSVWETVLSDPDPQGAGHWPLPGIGGIGRVAVIEGHVALAVTLRPNATQEQVDEIHRRLNDCEHVYKVIEDVAPAEVSIPDVEGGG